MRDARLIIIGAGMAGLAAGCYARLNGYDVQILEQHAIPGGLCTSWQRGAYTFDGAVRYLTGTRPGSPEHRLWQELGLLAERPIHFYDEFTCYEGTDGRTLHLYTDADRLEEHLLALAPADAAAIRDLAAGVRQFRRLDLPVDLTPTSPQDMLALGQGVLPGLGALLRWRTATVRSYAGRLRDPLLREALPRLFQFAPDDFPMMILLTTLASMNDHEAGYPVGGSRRLAEDLAARYVALGGEVRYRARVERILVENDRAVGVRLADGSEYRADQVISAADGHTTLFDLLEGRYVSERVRSYYRELPLSHAIVQVSLGMAADLSAQPATLSFPLRVPVMIGNVPHERLVLKHYCFDPTMAPPGHSVVTVWCAADYDWWARLRADRPAYRAEKERAAAVVIAALEERLPDLRGRVQEVDVATPATYERYTGNWRGAFAGWALTTRKMSMMMGGAMKKTLPGLAGFAMVGQWVEPGGSVALAAASGRDALKDLCAAAGTPFRTGLE